jgi:endonuclease-8
VPEGDTIAWTARRLRPALEGRVADWVHSPRHSDWPRRLTGRRITHIDAHGKHLFVHFEGGLAGPDPGLVLHSHLGMSGYWSVLREPPSSGGAWLVLRCGERWAVQRHGPTLELLTEGRRRFDQRLAALGPDVLAPVFDARRFLARLRSDDQTRPLGDALLDQRNVAGIGNIWKAEGCWEAQLDPWRRVELVSDVEALAVIEAVRPRMLRSAEQGPRTIKPRVYNRAGRPCPRCGATIAARGQGEANRTTYWCPGCQR